MSRKKKKKDYSVIEKEFMQFLNIYIKQLVESALDDIFKDFHIS